MNKDDDEFKDVEYGLPEEDTVDKAKANMIWVFISAGIIVALVILLIGNSAHRIFEWSGSAFFQVIETAGLSLIVACIQAWLFKSRIKSRSVLFISISVISGIVGGAMGGLLVNSGVLMVDSGISEALIVGLFIGAITGGLSSLFQNQIMKNIKYGKKWLIYSVISWALIYCVGWLIGWRPTILTFGLAAAFIIISTGVSLRVFLSKVPEIEFE